MSFIRKILASNSPIPQLNDKLQKIYDTLQEKLSNSRTNSDSSGSISLEVEPRLSTESIDQMKASDFTFLTFRTDEITVKESDSRVEIVVVRDGRFDIPAICEIETIDRTAIGGSHFKPIKELVTFVPNEIEKKVDIELVRDHEWSPDKIFLVKLSWSNIADKNSVKVGRHSIMQVTIVDDNDPGIVEFVQRFLVVPNSNTAIEVPLIRFQGSDGEIRVHWKTIDGTAKNVQHFYGGEGEVVFGEGVTKKNIQIPIVSDLDDRPEYFFEVVLVEATLGGIVGRINRVMITITDDHNYDNTVKRILPKLNSQSSLFLYRNEWLDQFRDAFAFSPETEARAVDYVLHFLSFGWKVMFAFIPPTHLCGGWLTFVSSLAIIGILTALMGDFASAFGCLAGLSDNVTALTFVALGTSLPDLFASRVAAVRERYADSAIGNIYGSNAFNVFLGLGLPWFVSSIYHKVNGTRFSVDAGTLEFSVSMFIVLSIVYSIILIARRNMSVFGYGELGGPRSSALFTFAVLIFFWLLYVALSIWWDITH